MQKTILIERTAKDSEITKLISYERVRELIPVSLNTIRKLVKDKIFPQPVNMLASAGSKPRFGFIESEVQDYINKQIELSRSKKVA